MTSRNQGLSSNEQGRQRRETLGTVLMNAMCVFVAEIICSTRVLGFQIFKLVFCIYNSESMTSLSLDPTL